MKKEYDFSKAEQGKKETLQSVINELLRKDIEIAKKMLA